jgi:DNA-binding response OmpR family regulator
VLVVDDDDRTRSGLTELLDSSGHQTESVATFEEAVLILRTRPPDLLITDVRLGTRNGLHLLGRLPTTVAVIVLTGAADPGLESQARDRGATFLLKPLDTGTLLDVVEALLSSRGGSGASE